jgi:hypothetical protein
MSSPSVVAATALLGSLSLCAGPAVSAPAQPIAIPTQARGAHLNASAALPGLRIFEGERLQTDPGGRVALRIGKSSLALVGNSRCDAGANFPWRTC